MMTKKLSLAGLLKESELALWNASDPTGGRRGRAAAWVTSDFNTLEVWRERHKHLMRPVAAATHRFGMAEKLRAVGVTLVERRALVDYLRKRQLAGAQRDAVIMRWRRIENSRRAVLEEHREYVLVLSSAVCVDHLLRYVGDSVGPRLLQQYRSMYCKKFNSECDWLLFSDTLDFASVTRTELPPAALSLKRVLTMQVSQ